VIFSERMVFIMIFFFLRVSMCLNVFQLIELRFN
jgi:hypothetical protein